MQNRNYKIKVYLMIAAALILIVSPLIIRLSAEKPYLPEYNTYYHLSSSEGAASMGYKGVLNDIYDYTINLGLHQSSLIVFFLITIFSIYFSLRRFKFTEEESFWMLFVLALSPAFIFAFSVPNSYAFYLSMISLAVFLFSKKQSRLYSLIPLAMVSLGDISIVIFTTFLILAMQLNYKEKEWKYISSFVLLSAVFWGLFKKPFSFEPVHSFNIFEKTLFDLGAVYGLSMVFITLFIFGIIISWKRSKFVRLMYIPLLAAIILIPFNPFVIIISLPVLNLFAGEGIKYILHREWKIDLLKRLSIILIIVSLLLSVLAAVEGIANLPPSADDIDAVRELSLLDNGNVLAPPDISTFLAYRSGFKTFPEYKDGDPMSIREYNTAIRSNNYKEIVKILEKERIKYVYINNEIRDSVPPDRGIFFLLQGERFKKVISTGDITVWRFDEDNVI